MVWRQGHLPIAGVFVRQFLDRAHCPPEKAAAVLVRAGLEPTSLADPELRVSEHQFSQILIGLSRVTRDEFWGMASAPVPLGAFRTFCRLASHCRNLGEALTVGSRFYRLVIQDFTLKVRTEEDQAIVWLQLRGNLGDQPRQRDMQGVALFITYQMMCWLTDRRLPLASRSFAFT